MASESIGVRSVRIDVTLLSGRTASISMSREGTVMDLRHSAQQQLGVGIRDLFTEAGQQLWGRSTLSEAGLQNGDKVTASVRDVEIVSCYGSLISASGAWSMNLPRHGDAFALLSADGEVVPWLSKAGERKIIGNDSRLRICWHSASR